MLKSFYVQIDLIHVEHTKCISSNSIKTNRNLFIFLISTLLLYIPLLALTDGETNTLTSRGLEEPFFISSCAVVSVFCSGGKQVVVLHTTYVLRSTIKLWCCVQFFWFWREIVLVFCTYGTYCTIQLCGCVSFWFWREIGFGFTYLQYNTIVVLCQFFGPGGKQLLTLRTYLVYNTVVGLCQFFG